MRAENAYKVNNIRNYNKVFFVYLHYAWLVRWMRELEHLYVHLIYLLWGYALTPIQLQYTIIQRETVLHSICVIAALVW